MRDLLRDLLPNCAGEWLVVYIITFFTIPFWTYGIYRLIEVILG